jgi:hypothetical protein
MRVVMKMLWSRLKKQQCRNDSLSLNPAAFIPDLAVSHDHYLLDSGHREEALNTIQDAILLRRRPAAPYPKVFTQGLVTSLRNISQLSDQGRRDEALEAGVQVCCDTCYIGCLPCLSCANLRPSAGNFMGLN